MWSPKLLRLGTRRNDRLNAAWIEWEKGFVVALHDQLKIASFCNPWNLVNVTHISMEVWVLKQLPLGAFEQDIVGDIESNESGEEANICKREFISTQVAKMA